MNENFTKRLKQGVRNSYILPGFLIAFISCQSFDSKKEQFKLNPLFNKVYNYSLTNISTKHFLDNTMFDTVKLDFALENIYSTDSVIIYKLTFNDFTWKRPPLNIKFENAGFSKKVTLKDPFVMLDSIGYFLHGRSVQVAINKKGIVEEVHGIDDLIENISNAGKANKTFVKSIMSDYISSNAVKDFLNRIFSLVPDAKVNEDDKWVRNVTLITKAPIKLSNLYIFEQHNGDTAYISIQSIVSAEQSEGGTVYMKGKQNGNAIVSYSTGMPYLYETKSETVTTTSQYDVVHKEHFILTSTELTNKAGQ